MNDSTEGLASLSAKRVKLKTKHTGSKYDAIYPKALEWMKQNKKTAESADLKFGMPKGTMRRLLARP